MRLTRETDYALRGLSVLAGSPFGAVRSLADVAAGERLPGSFLKKIFRKLVRHGILRSSRGAGHGYALARSPEAISLLEIVEAVQGPDELNHCVFWSGHCGGANPCLLHDRWLAVRPLMRALFEGTTLADVARSRRLEKAVAGGAISSRRGSA